MSDWRASAKHEVEGSVWLHSIGHGRKGAEEQVGQAGCNSPGSPECNPGKVPFSYHYLFIKNVTHFQASENPSMGTEYIEETLEVDT